MHTNLKKWSNLLTSWNHPRRCPKINPASISLLANVTNTERWTKEQYCNKWAYQHETSRQRKPSPSKQMTHTKTQLLAKENPQKKNPIGTNLRKWPNLLIKLKPSKTVPKDSLSLSLSLSQTSNHPFTHPIPATIFKPNPALFNQTMDTFTL